MLEAHAGSGCQRVTLRLWDVGNGWMGSLTGGTVPHVGGVVLAVPRPSLSGDGNSCDIWSIPAPGHLDHEMAAPIAKQLCIKLAATVSLTAGIHIDMATAEDLASVKENCETALKKVVAEIGFY